MTTTKNMIKRHPVLTFYLLAFLISWAALLPVMGLEGFFGLRETPETQMPLLFLAVLAGPSISGLLLTSIVYGRTGLRELLKRALKWRVGLRWYVAALLIAPLAMAVSLLVLSQFWPALLPSIVTADNRLSFVIAGIVGGLSAGIFEELGWTGFAVPELRRRHGIVTTGLIVGLLWGAWHYPLFSASGRYSGSIPPALYILVLLFSFLPAYRVLMVWVYARTESLLIAILMHTSLTASTMIFQPTATGSQAMIYNLALTGVLWLIVLGITLINRAQPSRQPISKRAA